jgi:hypothetical protein
MTFSTVFFKDLFTLQKQFHLTKECDSIGERKMFLSTLIVESETNKKQNLG